jgi:hypothetical protein
MGKERNTEALRSRGRQLEGLPVISRSVAGIDLGSERHWVCAPTIDGAGREIADFGGTTSELIRMAKWLKERNVDSIAMESTGVYWIAPHEVLEAESFQILLVDTRQLARVPGATGKRIRPTVSGFSVCTAADYLKARFVRGKMCAC